MPRNFFRRIELMFPIDDPRLKTRVIDEVMRILLSDNMKARQLQPDGSYLRVVPGEGQLPVRSQVIFQTLARGSARETGEHPLQFIPASDAKDGEPGSEREAAVIPGRRKRRVRIARPRDGSAEPGTAAS
jgi:hypothetical protein